MANDALDTNPPVFNGVLADIHITPHGSDWFWAAFSIFALAAIVTLLLAFLRPVQNRIFHYISAAIFIVAAVNYFTLASDLGFVPVQVEWQRDGKVSGQLRQIFYSRYIDWFLTTPLLLINLFLTAALPWSNILFAAFVANTSVICGLVGALVPSKYKWGYYTIGVVVFSYVMYTIALPARQRAAALGSDVSRVYTITGAWLVMLFVLYPIAWAVAEGANIITPDSEAAFYGVIDVLIKVGSGALLILGHRDIEPARLGLRVRGYDELPSGAPLVEKNGNGSHATTPAASV